MAMRACRGGDCLWWRRLPLPLHPPPACATRGAALHHPHPACLSRDRLCRVCNLALLARCVSASLLRAAEDDEDLEGLSREGGSGSGSRSATSAAAAGTGGDSGDADAADAALTRGSSETDVDSGVMGALEGMRLGGGAPAAGAGRA